VEKTASTSDCVGASGKHLHGRGEDLATGTPVKLTKETPPLAWRRPKRVGELKKRVRNTSTCVEKTTDCIKPGREAWKHLHVRGEDLKTVVISVTP